MTIRDPGMRVVNHAYNNAIYIHIAMLKPYMVNHLQIYTSVM